MRQVFKQQIWKLDIFFHKLLWKNLHTRPFLENHKAILMGNLFDEMVKVHSRENYEKYVLQKLIFIKAKRIYIDYIRSLERENNRQKKVKTDMPPEDHAIGSFRSEVEARDAVILIKDLLNPDDYKLLYMRGALGMSYKQILKNMNFPSEDAAKSQYYRVRQLVRQQLTFQIMYKN